jgi:beta-catenin-like protein 1
MFIRSFIGAKKWYVFTTGENGPGYYIDEEHREFLAKNGAVFQPRLGNVFKAGGDRGKKRKLETSAAEVDDDAGLTQEEKIAKILDAGDKVDIQNLTATSIKSMLLAFEKRINKNQMMRMKYPDQPDKFMDSEIELDEQLKKLRLIAASPHLYPEVVKMNSVGSILGLISHENTDISIESISLINELTDPEVLLETEEAICLVDSLVENQGLELLVKNLERLDEADEEDAQGVHHTMNIIENLTEVRPAICTQICECSDILKYLLKRLKVKKFDRNKLYCSEILSILTQADIENKKRVGQLAKPDGVDLLLQVAAYYRRRDPQNLEEAECVQNVFSCLANVVLGVPENQTKFRHSEGLELMIRCMREQKYARTCAIKVPTLLSYFYDQYYYYFFTINIIIFFLTINICFNYY